MVVVELVLVAEEGAGGFRDDEIESLLVGGDSRESRLMELEDNFRCCAIRFMVAIGCGLDVELDLDLDVDLVVVGGRKERQSGDILV